MSDTLTASAAPARAQERTYRWLVLAAATVAQATACFLVQGLGSIAGYIEKSLHLSVFEIGLLVSAAQFVPLVGLLAAGELLDRFGERWLVGIGALIVSAAIAGAAMSPTYTMLLVWLVVLGAGYSTAQPGGSKSVSSWFSRSQRGLAMGIRQAGLPLGGAMAAAVLPLVAGVYGWRAAFLVGAGVAFLGGIVFIGIYRSPSEGDAVPQGRPAPSRLSTLRGPGMRNIVWSGVTLITVQYGILIFTALYLRDRFGLSLGKGATLLSVALAAGVAGRIGLAAWSDRCRRGRYFVVAASMWALVAGLLGLMLGVGVSFISLGLLAAWLGFFGFGWYGPWVAHVAETAPPDRVGWALGQAMAINQIAVVAGPPALGLSRDLTGSYVATWLALVVMLLAALLATRGRSRRRSSSAVSGHA